MTAADLKAALLEDTTLRTICPNIRVSDADGLFVITAATASLEAAWTAGARLDAVLAALSLTCVGRLAYGESGAQHWGGVYRAVSA